MTKYWFFDLDGTLADTDPDIRTAWKAALRELGVECPNFDRDFIAGPTIEEMARRLLPEVATDAFCARLRARFGFHYDHDGFPNTFEYPGVLDAVRRLKAIGKLRKPELLAYILRELGAAPGECALVGDTGNDFEAAAKNGVASVAVSWGYGTDAERAKATRIAKNPDEI